MSRVCLCITGQMRNVEWTVRQLHWAVEHHDVTVIFSVWDRVGRKVDGALNLYQLARMFDRGAFTAIPTEWHGFNVLWRRLPALYEKLLPRYGTSDEAYLREVIGRYLPNAVVDLESTSLLDLEFQEERQDKNSVRMTYKIWRANQIRRRIERSAGPFDVVIRVRPDLNFVNLRIAEIAERVLQGEFLVNNWLGNWSGDNFCAGKPAEMDAYASIFGRTVLLPLQWEFIHTDLAGHLHANGLKVARYIGLEDPLDDEKITTTDLAAALERQKSENQVWSETHDAVLAAAHAAQRLDASDPQGALAELHRHVQGATIRPSEVDGFLYTLGRTLLETGSSNAAAACFVAARYWEREGDDPRRRMALQAIAAMLSANMDPATPFALGPVVDAVAADFEPAWVAEMLVKEGSEPTLHARLTALFGEALGSPEAQIALTEEFARSGPTHLALAALDHLATSLDEADHRKLGQSLVTASITDPPVGGEPDASSALDYAVKLASRNIHFGYELANTLKETGRYPEARAIQQAVLDLDPSHPGANRQMAEICMHLGDADAARNHAAKAVSLDAQPDHRILLAFAEFKRGERDLAQAEWETLPQPAVASPAYSTLPGFDEFLRLGARTAQPVADAPA